ncbi:MAG: hypothetical protein GHCLOJNM_03768 [bacterium]|nr:hypothetical protein [bacterium]
MGVDILAVIMVFSIPLVAILCGFGITALKILKGKDGSGSVGGAGASKEDVQTIQELNRIAVRMEKRIEALETLLLDRVREADRTVGDRE